MINGELQLAFWCDGSLSFTNNVTVQGKPGGYGVVWRSDIDGGVPSTPTVFKSRGFYVNKAYSIQHMEMAAICQALAKAIELASKVSFERCRVVVFTDSKSSVDRINLGVGSTLTGFYNAHTEPLTKAIICQSHKLDQLGCLVELNWVPRCATEALKLADKLAGRWSEDDADVCQHRQTLDMRDSVADRLHSEIKLRGQGALHVRTSKYQRKRAKKNAMMRKQNAQTLASVHHRASSKAKHRRGGRGRHFR
ncbi:hypothetical protein QBC41DRAFT_224265 [Cercophora samala]|uniref:RNase H type-1 domain-containing protein n=1 Tax=Cercophora samala TaxID=330535 RepID=A0AA39ZF00_9PEZI|nr:hypothetical protein QBC41DRAFT_224265 [Cercophora samala]